MKDYIVWFVQFHLEFRLPEFESLCATFDVPYEITGTLDNISPFLYVKFRSDEDAKLIASRGIMIKGIYQVWGESKDYEGLEASINKFQENNKEEIQKYMTSKWTFKVVVDGFGRKYTVQQQREKMEHFKFMDVLQVGTVYLKNPDYIFWIVEEIGENQDKDALPKRVFFMKEIALGIRGVIDTFVVNKRAYIGTTSMESTLALLVANMAKTLPGKLIYDPFTGTGSLLLTCSHFGAITFGGDLDPRVLRGKNGKNVQSNFDQYKLAHRFAGLIINDNSKLDVWRQGEIFDAIVGDPPYGVRAGAKKVGMKPNRKVKQVPDELPSPHVPQCIPYPINDVLIDLLVMAARSLLLHGRLVYWLPTTNQFKDTDVPQHPCLKLIANSEQVLSNSISRRLITMEKVIAYDPAIHNIDMRQYNSELPEAAHFDFPTKYYAGKQPGDAETTPL